MKIVHYSPKENSIRYCGIAREYLDKAFMGITSYSDNENIYNISRTPSDFKHTLSNRIELPDIVMIMAHGSHSAILKASGNHRFEKVFTSEEVDLLVNDFVFAFSCYTFNKLGICAIEKGALVYIGFDDSIEQVFTINNEFKDISNKLEIIIKRIYMLSVAQEFEKFIKNCYTAKEFYLRLMLRVNTEILKLKKMRVNELNETFNLNFKEYEDSKINEIIRLEIISKFDYINEKMKIVGEENYVPWYFIDLQSNEKLPMILEKNELLSYNNERYKDFIKTLVNNKLKSHEKPKSNLTMEKQAAEKIKETSFYDKIFVG